MNMFDKKEIKTKPKLILMLEDFCWKRPATVLFCSGLVVGLLLGMLF